MSKSEKDDWIAEGKLPEKVSIIELMVVGRKLNVNVDAIRDKHIDATREELRRAVEAAMKGEVCEQNV